MPDARYDLDNITIISRAEWDSATWDGRPLPYARLAKKGLEMHIKDIPDDKLIDICIALQRFFPQLEKITNRKLMVPKYPNAVEYPIPRMSGSDTDDETTQEFEDAYKGWQRNKDEREVLNAQIRAMSEKDRIRALARMEDDELNKLDRELSSDELARRAIARKKINEGDVQRRQTELAKEKIEKAATFGRDIDL